MLLGTVCLVGISVVSLGEVLSLLPDVGSDGRVYAETMLKIVGAGYVFGICSDVCSQLGQASLSNAVILCGRVEIVALSAPFIKRIVEEGAKLL